MTSIQILEICCKTLSTFPKQVSSTKLLFHRKTDLPVSKLRISQTDAVLVNIPKLIHSMEYFQVNDVVRQQMEKHILEKYTKHIGIYYPNLRMYFSSSSAETKYNDWVKTETDVPLKLQWWLWFSSFAGPSVVAGVHAGFHHLEVFDLVKILEERNVQMKWTKTRNMEK